MATIRLMVVFAAASFFVPCFGQKNKEEKGEGPSAAYSVAKGVFQGGSEFILGRPLANLQIAAVAQKNSKIAPQQLVSPKHGGFLRLLPAAYAGSIPHLAYVFPIAIAQRVAADTFSQWCSPLQASLAAGAVCSVVNTPFERSIVEVVVNKKPLAEIVKQLGFRGLNVGIGATAVREAIFAMGYNQIVQQVDEQVSSVIENPYASRVAASLISGPVLAAVSQIPEQARLLLQTGRVATYREFLAIALQSPTTLFKGFGPRAARYACALYTISTSGDFFDKTWGPGVSKE